MTEERKNTRSTLDFTDTLLGKDTCAEKDDNRDSIDFPIPSNAQFVSQIEHPVTIQFCKSNIKFPPLTIPSFFADAVRLYSRRMAFVSYTKIGDFFETATYSEYYNKAMEIAKGVLALGVQPGDGVGFTCQNSSRSFCAIMGTILAGGIYVDLHAADNRNWMIQTMTDCKVSVVFVDSVSERETLVDIWDELCHFRVIVVLQSHLDTRQDKRTMSLLDLVDEGLTVTDQELAKRLGSHAPNKCCAVFYRSNEVINQVHTPGYMMSHDNLTIMANILAQMIFRGKLGKFSKLRHKAIKLISITPITKPFAFVYEILLPIALGGCVYTKPKILSTVALWRLLVRVRPNIFCCSIRTWSQLRNRVEYKTRKLSKVRSILLKYAQKAMLTATLEGSSLPNTSRLVMKGIARCMGLEDCGLFCSFGEALPQNIYEYFLSLNIPIYALRETPFLSGPHFICTPSDVYRTEALGNAIQQFKTKMIRVGKTMASKVFVRGRHVCMGILHDQATMAKHIDQDGFLDTDILTVSVHEDLFVVGTTAEVVVMKNGATLPYRYVERSFKQHMPIVENCMLVGNNKKCAGMLITLKTLMNPETLMPTDMLTPEVQDWCEQKLGARYVSAEVLACSKKLHVVMNAILSRINRLLNKSGGWIATYKILPRTFSVLDREVDPTTHELNRYLIMERYRYDLTKLFSDKL